jgi:hypothetical protein
MIASFAHLLISRRKLESLAERTLLEWHDGPRLSCGSFYFLLFFFLLFFRLVQVFRFILLSTDASRKLPRLPLWLSHSGGLGVCDRDHGCL